MSQDQLVELALSIARDAHEGQVDKSGHAYIEHPTRVAERLRRDWLGIELNPAFAAMAEARIAASRQQKEMSNERRTS